MNVPNNDGSSSESAGQQRQEEPSTADASQQLLQQLQLVMQQQQNQQPLTTNSLALSALLGNPLLGSLAMPAAAANTSNPLQQQQQQQQQQQPALLAFPSLSSSVHALTTAPLPAISSSFSSLLPSLVNPNIDYLQLLGLAQLHAQQLQQQRQQLIPQLLVSFNASNANVLAPLPPQIATGVGVQAAAPAASTSPLRSSYASTSSRPDQEQKKERQGKTTKTDGERLPPSSSLIPPTNRPPIPLTTEYDSQALNPYQCLLREQIELFETGEATGVEGCSQGRNAQIKIGQVGIRCRYCARLPNKSRPKGAVYYSKTVRGIYQTSQNMAHVHFAERCKTIPSDIRLRLQRLYGSCRRATAGKDFWEECLRAQGVYEDGQTLRFRPLPETAKGKKKS